MGNIRVRKETGRLLFDFRYQGQRCREQTALPDTPVNRKKLRVLMERIDAEIAVGSFDYARYFPQSAMIEELRRPTLLLQAPQIVPLFRDFVETWYSEHLIEWRRSYFKTIRITLDRYLLSTFGEKPVNALTKADILAFRSTLAEPKGSKRKTGLSPSRINHIMTPLRMILAEAAERFHFVSPFQGIKPLKVPRTDVEPFTFDEVKLIISTVRPDFRNYYSVRFLTGMRTAEIDGLKWRYIDWNRRQILIRETIVLGEIGETKTDGSVREIDMSSPVYDALRAQAKITGEHDFVFCNRKGLPVEHKNVTNRVWYPLLRHLGLRKRRPYQTRHTAATLWLAAGENPEWIARQMGHTTTEMLFRVYSRFVPNLTRKDGSAFERLILTIAA
jgi:integrase